MKLDLEAREQQARAQGSEEEESLSSPTLEQEIARLRKEGSLQLEQQQRLVQEQIRRDRQQRRKRRKYRRQRIPQTKAKVDVQEGG